MLNAHGEVPARRDGGRVNPKPGSFMATQLQRQIIQAVRAGMDLATIEQTIIDPATMEEDEKAALWLLAQALRERDSLTREPAPVGS
jgi:hypothetical protein